MSVIETTTLAPGIWALDPTHTEISFTIRHMGLSKVRGRFNTFTGTAAVAEDLTTSAVEATINMASVDTNNEMRDNHLRSTDFFDIENHPTMTFTSTAIETKGNDGVIRGNLTINGVTKPVELATEFFGVAVDGYGNTKAGFNANTQISRSDYGISFNMPLEAGGLLLSDKVTIDLDVQLAKQA